MPILKAEFDGKTFVPRQPVALPVGTEVDVVLPTPRPREPTPEEADEWQAILRDIASSPPAFPTVEEALRHSRSRP